MENWKLWTESTNWIHEQLKAYDVIKKKFIKQEYLQPLYWMAKSLRRNRADKRIRTNGKRKKESEVVSISVNQYLWNAVQC